MHKAVLLRKLQGLDGGPVVSCCLRAWRRSNSQTPAFAPHRTNLIKILSGTFRRSASTFSLKKEVGPILPLVLNLNTKTLSPIALSLMIGPHLNNHVARQRVAFSWQVHPIAHRLNKAIKNKAKSVAYATYTVVSSSTVTTEPFLKSYKSGSSFQPIKPPRRCARYTNLMACDLHVPMCSHLNEFTVSRREELHDC
jgi:hypothetical protein